MSSRGKRSTVMRLLSTDSNHININSLHTCCMCGLEANLPYCSATQWLSEVSPLMHTFSVLKIYHTSSQWCKSLASFCSSTHMLCSDHLKKVATRGIFCSWWRPCCTKYASHGNSQTYLVYVLDEKAIRQLQHAWNGREIGGGEGLRDRLDLLEERRGVWETVNLLEHNRWLYKQSGVRDLHHGKRANRHNRKGINYWGYLW